MKRAFSIGRWDCPLRTISSPLSQLLIPPDLATAFNVSAHSRRTAIEVNRASHLTLFNLRNPNSLVSFADADRERDPTVIEAEGEEEEDGPSVQTLKRAKLVWNPQLHKRFVDAVAHLGIQKAVPKSIMRLMNVEGLTRDNVASHLQKYRLFLKRMSTDDQSDSQGRGQIPPPLMAVPVFGMAYGQGHMGTPVTDCCGST